MPTVAEIVERARADLAKAEQREVRAREALEAAAVEKQRLANFLSVLAQYGDPPTTKPGASPVKSRFSKQGTAAVEVITDHMEPMSIDALGNALEQMGVEIGGGAKRNAYLASYLSKDPRLEFIRGKGWWVLELGSPPSDTTPTSPKDTEPPDDHESEGSGVAGTARNGPADREAGASLLEPTTTGWAEVGHAIKLTHPQRSCCSDRDVGVGT